MVNLKKIIKRPVDLIEEDCLLPFASKSANRDKILIYDHKEGHACLMPQIKQLLNSVQFIEE